MVTEEVLLTVDDVNQRLPLVRSIVRDVVALHGDLSARRSRLSELRSRYPVRSRTDPLYEAEVQAMEAELAQDEQRLSLLAGELNQIGGELTNPSTGTVDFPSELAGERISLCWQFDEPRVMAWHATSCGVGPRIALTDEKTGQGVSTTSLPREFKR
jgi:hypothetical protein